jgi:hypothetical protein
VVETTGWAEIGMQIQKRVQVGMEFRMSAITLSLSTVDPSNKATIILLRSFKE